MLNDISASNFSLDLKTNKKIVGLLHGIKEVIIFICFLIQILNLFRRKI